MGFGQSVLSKTRKYGWKPDLGDVRDKTLTFNSNNLKSKVDLRDKFGEVYDQGALGSCTSNAICSAFMYDQMRQNLPPFEPSRLFLYYNERNEDNMTQIDSGSSIRKGLKSINRIGICDEKLWPYQPEYFRNTPYSMCYNDSKFQKCIRYKRITNTLGQLQACLTADKPFIFGFSVYDSFEDPTIWNPKSDEMPIPNPNKEKLLGGHAVVAVGYSNKRRAFLIRNSWGTDWGMDGYFLMPYQFITSSQCSDFWVIDSVSDDEVIVEKIITINSKKHKKKARRRRIERENSSSICSGADSENSEIKTVKVDDTQKDTQRDTSKSSKCLIVN